MMYDIVEPSRRIAKEAIKVWRITSTIVDSIGIIIAGSMLWISYHFDWVHWLKIIFWIAIIILPLFTIWEIFIRPKLLYTYWRYGVDENYVRLQHGIFTRTDVVIPMTKIQYVEANQGPLMRKYNLYSLSVGTLADSHDIPALPKKEAFALRDQISEHAKLKEVE